METKDNEPLVVGRLVSLKGSAEKNPLAEALRGLMENLPAYLASVDAIEQMRRAKYLALIKNGFTEAQALELCKTL